MTDQHESYAPDAAHYDHTAALMNLALHPHGPPVVSPHDAQGQSRRAQQPAAAPAADTPATAPRENAELQAGSSGDAAVLPTGK